MIKRLPMISQAESTAIVLYPSPLRGHIVAMIEFGKLLLRHRPDLHVTVLLASGAASTAATDPGLTFLRLPVDTEGETASTSSTPFDLTEKSTGTLRRTLESLSETTAIAALVIDCFSDSAFPVAASLGIPTFYYMTSGAIMLSLCLYLPMLDETFTANFKDLKDEIIRIPGLPPVPAPDMPSGLLDRNHKMYAQILRMANNLVYSSGIIVNTCESLERRAIEAVRDGLHAPGRNPPRVFPVGPLVESKDDGSKVRDSHECLVWLDRQPSKSVVFLCFGSEGVFSVQLLKEIAEGLERSGVRFLWVVRPPPDTAADSGDPSGAKQLDDLLPEGFLERTRDKGMVVKPWVPQIDVLDHKSVGGFVTHCGWNSSIEAMRAGVPMVAWPLYAEQKVNRAFLVEEIGVAVTVIAREEDGLVSAEEVEGRVDELMNAEKRVGISERVASVMDGIEKDMSSGGSSGESLAEFVHLIKFN